MLHCQGPTTLLAGQILAALPFLWIAAYLYSPDQSLDYRPYYLFTSLKGAIDMFPIVMSSIADKLPPEMRASMFTLTIACVSFAMILGSLLGGILDAKAAARTCVVIMLSVFVCSVVGVKGATCGAAVITIAAF
jgi:MFS family permease